jgi:hypothetical protein
MTKKNSFHKEVKFFKKYNNSMKVWRLNQIT